MIFKCGHGHFQIKFFLLTSKLDQFACWVKEVNGPFQASTMEEDLYKTKCRLIGAESTVVVCKLSTKIKERERWI